MYVCDLCLFHIYWKVPTNMADGLLPPERNNVCDLAKYIFAYMFMYICLSVNLLFFAVLHNLHVAHFSLWCCSCTLCSLPLNHHLCTIFFPAITRMRHETIRTRVKKLCWASKGIHKKARTSHKVTVFLVWSSKEIGSNYLQLCGKLTLI